MPWLTLPASALWCFFVSTFKYDWRQMFTGITPPVKVWSKRRCVFCQRSPIWHPLMFHYRKINAPYKGTLSSYGYVLLVIYFLVHVKNPPVLPNLQQMPPLRPISPVCFIFHRSPCQPNRFLGRDPFIRTQHLVIFFINTREAILTIK